MKLNDIEVLVTKVDLKKNSKGEAYILIDLLDIISGDAFNIMSKNIELMKDLSTMTKYIVNLNLTSSKFGLRLELDKVGEVTGKI